MMLPKLNGDEDSFLISSHMTNGKPYLGGVPRRSGFSILTVHFLNLMDLSWTVRPFESDSCICTDGKGKT
jgi:hypothetical protein